MNRIGPYCLVCLIFAAFVGLGPVGMARAADQPAESPQEALLIYRDAANFQNNSAFELAADEWENFLKKFPKDPLAPKATHYLGVCNLQLKRYQEAADAFAKVVAQYPELDAIQDAYLNLGWCQYSLAGQNVEGMHASAAKTFSQMAEKFPKGKYADQAFFFWGESEYHQGKKAEAVKGYQQVVDNFPKSSLRPDALYALGVTQEELGEFAAAGVAYDAYLKEFKDNPLATEVAMRKGETILQAGDYAAAEKIFADAAAAKDFAMADHALSRQAFCLFKQDKVADAAKLYAKLATDYPQAASAPDARISAARFFYQADQHPEAQKWFQAVLDGDPSNAPEAAHWLCRIALKKGDAKQAAALATKAIPQAADSPFLVDLQMDLADAQYETPESRPAALALYLKIASEHPQDELAPQALYNAAFATLELKKLDEGTAHAAAFLKAYPEHRLLPDVKYVAAECLLLAGKHAEAEKAYRELIAAFPEHAESETWKVRLGLAVYLQKNYDETVKTLEPVVAGLKAPAILAEAQFLLGASQFYREQHAAAIASLEASQKADPQWRQADEVALLLARAQRGADQASAAIATLKKLIADFPNSDLLDHAHYRLGEFSYAQNDFETTVAEYDTVVAKWPNSPFAPFALYGKGWAQIKTKAYAEAGETFTALITTHAKDKLVPDACFARAMCRRQTKQYAEAIEDVNVFLKSNPEANSKSDALYERGLAEVALGKQADAVATFQQLLADNPKYAGADKVLYELAWALKSMTDDAPKAEAVTTFAKLAQEYPDSSLAAEAFFHVGESHYEKREFDQAVAAYTSAKSKAGPGELGEKSTYKLGWSFFQQKVYDQALVEFTEQADKYPQGVLSSDALFMKAECLFRQEKYPEALAAYTATQTLTLSSPTISALALLHGGQSAAQTKQWPQAITMLSAILEKHADSPYVAEAHYELGFAQQNSAQEDEALKHYEQAATISRGAVGARARFMIGELYFGKKDYPEAVRQFQRAMFGYGGDAATDDVKQWQAKSGVEAGRATEVQIEGAAAAAKAGLIAEAKKFYQYVVDKHPQSDLVAQATKRLQELSKL